MLKSWSTREDSIVGSFVIHVLGRTWQRSEWIQPLWSLSSLKRLKLDTHAVPEMKFTVCLRFCSTKELVILLVSITLFQLVNTYQLGENRAFALALLGSQLLVGGANGLVRLLKKYLNLLNGKKIYAIFVWEYLQEDFPTVRFCLVTSSCNRMYLFWHEVDRCSDSWYDKLLI